MNLRKTAVLIICATFCGLFTVLYAISQSNIQASFNLLEQQEVEEELTRGLRYLEEDNKALESTNADWSIWDDTYQFIVDRNPEYVHANVTKQSLENIHIDLLALYDTAGHFVYGQRFNADGALEQISPELAKRLEASPLLGKTIREKKTFSGFLAVAGELWMIASGPVLPSVEEGTVRGTLIMGRRLDAEKIQKINEIIMLDLAVTKLQASGASPRIKDIAAALTRTGQHLIVPDGEDLIHGYALLRDVMEQPVAILSVSMPRRIHQQERITQRNNFVYLVVIGMVFGLAILILMERRIISRVTRLSLQIDHLGQHPEHSQRTDMTGNDEITALSKAINAMLDALDHARSRYEMATRAAKVAVWEYGVPTASFYIDPSFQELLGYSETNAPEGLKGWLERVHPEDRERVRADLQDFIKGAQDTYVAEQRMLAMDGSVHWILVRGRTVRDDAGIVARLVGTHTDITELKLAEANIRKLTGDLITAQEDERSRIARDLHDNVAQGLSVAKIACETLLDGIQPTLPVVETRLTACSSLLSRAISSVRELSYDLLPPDLDLGLPLALERLCEDFTKAFGIEATFEAVGLGGLAVEQDVAINIYRIVQEALTNVRRHSGASHVSVRLVESYPKLIARIKDDGQGFVPDALRDQDEETRHMGLASMRERVSLFGGRLRIVSEPGGGCLIVAEVLYAGDRGHGGETSIDR